MAAPVVNVFTDSAPCPRVEVFFGAFDPGTASVTVYRLAGGREFQVRGAVLAPTAGTLSRIDFEVPFNQPVTYRAEQFGALGQSLGFTPSTTVTVPSAHTWVHNPLEPQGSMRVEFGRDTATRITRPTPGVVARPKGRTRGVVMSEPRQGVMGLQIDIRTRTTAEADAVQAMFGDGGTPPVVCVRLGSDYGRMRIPQPLFLSALEVPEDDINIQWAPDGEGEISHPVRGDEVDPPIPGLFVALLRAKDINVSFPTAAALNASALTAAEVNRRYDLAGAAG